MKSSYLQRLQQQFWKQETVLSMMPIQKGEFYVMVPITYFSDAFQDILARDGFFISWKFKKMFLEKNTITFLKPL